MRDVNYPAQKSYRIALTGITYNGGEVPVYYGEIPDSMSPDAYIVYGGIVNTDASTMNSADTFSLMRVTIHTFQLKYNTGKAAGDIAGQVLARILPTPGFNIDLSPDNMQCVNTQLSNDSTLDYSIINARTYLDRVLTFRHRVFHR